MAPMVGACLAVAALSLLGPSEPSYDPWAWLVWGREIGHLTLDTTGGPSWKPLPLLFTIPFAPLSSVNDGIPPALWIVLARTGGLLAVVLAFRVAGRVVGGGPARRAAAGVVATAALLLTPDWVRYLAHGSEAPLAVGLALLAVDRHLDGRRSAALVAGSLACLARPELFGFLLLYGAYLCLGSPRSRALVAGALVLVVAAWLVPPWLSSGDPLGAGTTARSEPSWSLSHMPVPWRAALGVAQRQAWLALELAALWATLLALAAVRRPGRGLPAPADPRAVIVLALLAGANVVLYAAMTQAGFSGNPRYVLPGVALIAVIGGVGVGLLAGVVARADRGRIVRLGAAAAASLLLAAAVPEIVSSVRSARLEADEAAERSRLHSELEHAVDTVGAGYVALFGPAAVNRSYQTHLAWELSESTGEVHLARGRGLAFRAPVDPVAGPVRIYARARPRATIARVGSWAVSERLANARHVFSWPVQGFSLRVAAARFGA